MRAARTGHNIRWGRGNQTGLFGDDEPSIVDDFMTPPTLSEMLIRRVPLQSGDVVLDPFRGTGSFYNALPLPKEWAEVKEGRDFFDVHESVAWIVSNPPYSTLDVVLKHSAAIATKGIAYLLAFHAVTPRRLEYMEGLGFGLTGLHLTKVFKWYGISAFCIFERNKPSIVSYDRTVWYEDD